MRGQKSFDIVSEIRERFAVLKTEYLVLAIIFTIVVLLFLPNSFSSETKYVVVPKGAGASKITSILKKEGIIRSKLAFRIILGIRGGTLKAGEYEFSPSMFPWTVVSVLKSGKISSHSVTIPEGFTVRQIAGLLAEKGLACEKRILKLCSDREFIKNTGIDAAGLEGYLFPSTYFVTRGMTEEDILHMMTKEFKDSWEKSGLESVLTAKKKKLNEIVKLASLIEREAETDFDRPLISAVFVNRLKRNMKLESCATVVYAYGEKEVQKNRLLGKDLLIESPYNTYLHYGMPPGPICNPGMASIKAAVYPAENKMLFFVLNNDGSRSHIFSETKAQHDQAILASKASKVQGTSNKVQDNKTIK